MAASEDDLSGISFHDPRWLQAFPLTKDTVLDYFSLSSGDQGFYDRTCNNQICKMQGLPLDKLKEMVGLEYTVVESLEPYLYVIRKSRRESPTDVTPLASFYCLNGVIYQAPTLLSACNSRIISSIFYLRNALAEIKKFEKFSPASGYYWDFEASGDINMPPPGTARKQPLKIDKERVQSVDKILKNLHAQFTVPLPGGASNRQAIEIDLTPTSNPPVIISPSPGNTLAVPGEHSPLVSPVTNSKPISPNPQGNYLSSQQNPQVITPMSNASKQPIIPTVVSSGGDPIKKTPQTHKRIRETLAPTIPVVPTPQEEPKKKRSRTKKK